MLRSQQCFNVKVQHPPSSARKFNLSFPPARVASMAKNCALAAAKNEQVKVVTFETGVKPLVLEKKERSTKQYAMSTIQQPKTGREPSSRARYKPVDRYGAFDRGEKKFATSVLDSDKHPDNEPEEDVMDDDIDMSSDTEHTLESEMEISEPHKKNARTVTQCCSQGFLCFQRIVSMFTTTTSQMSKEMTVVTPKSIKILCHQISILKRISILKSTPVSVECMLLATRSRSCFRIDRILTCFMLLSTLCQTESMRGHRPPLRYYPLLVHSIASYHR